jgi:hypothetical protein
VHMEHVGRLSRLTDSEPLEPSFIKGKLPEPVAAREHELSDARLFVGFGVAGFAQLLEQCAVHGVTQAGLLHRKQSH